VVQSVLDQVDSKDVRVYVVWEPILITDRAGAVPAATALIPDHRAIHYWAPDLELAHAFRGPLGLTREAAWDVYLVYDRAARWQEGGGAPTPSSYQHQLYGEPEERFLDEASLVVRLRELLAR
jgi:hypothetical protein